MVPEPVKEKLDCDESEALVQQCEQWSRELVSSYPHRKVMNDSVLQFRFLDKEYVFFLFYVLFYLEYF